MPSEECPEENGNEGGLRPGEVISRWRAVEWTEVQRSRLAALLIGSMPNDSSAQAS